MKINSNKNDDEYIFYVIGQNIKKQRKIKGWTQEQLAIKCMYNRSFIANLESKKVFQTVSIGCLNHIAKTLGIHITRLLDDLDVDENKKI